MNSSSKPEVIGIASGKGGVGKTTVSVNLSVALAAQGKRVLLFDADLGLANAQIA
ncbi:MAG: AAA family ATPase, partial [Burkholderiaceae bacterium]